MADPTDAPSPETTPEATPEKKGGGVVTQRRVVSVPLALVDPKKAAAALAAANSAHAPKPRNAFHVDLQIMKRKHDRPGQRTASYMSDVKG